MKLEHISLILGLTKNELKRRLELGLVDQEMLNRQVSEHSQQLKLDALCDSWRELHSEDNSTDQIDKYETNNLTQDPE